MTFAIIGALIGAALGLFRARRAKGNRLDQLQYAAVYAIVGGLLGMVAAIAVVRSL